MRIVLRGVCAAALLLGSTLPLSAQVNARLLRYPAVSQTHIAFVYGGDVWVVGKGGGVAHRLSSPAGEEAFPRFSPDGGRIAFTGNYDGNPDIYVIPTMGGAAERITFHPEADRVIEWSADGRILFASTRTVPTFAIYSDGEWIIENHGVEPDIEVEADPAQMWNGGDPQLERAVEEVMRALQERPPVRPARPAYTRRVPTSD